jgi:hypothetical protein
MHAPEPLLLPCAFALLPRRVHWPAQRLLPASALPPLPLPELSPPQQLAAQLLQTLLLPAAVPVLAPAAVAALAAWNGTKHRHKTAVNELSHIH